MVVVGGGILGHQTPPLSLLAGQWEQSQFSLPLVSTRIPRPDKGLKARRPSDHRPKLVKSWANINLFLPCKLAYLRFGYSDKGPPLLEFRLYPEAQQLAPDAVQPVCYVYARLRLETESGLLFFFLQLFLHLPISVCVCRQVFSTSATWVLEIKLQPSDLVARLRARSHLTAPSSVSPSFIHRKCSSGWRKTRYLSRVFLLPQSDPVDHPLSHLTQWVILYCLNSWHQSRSSKRTVTVWKISLINVE